MMSVWPWLFLESESSWSWSLRTSSIQCHSNPVLVPPCKPTDTVKDIYDGHTYDLKQGWIYGWGWMWFQLSMKHFLRNFTLIMWLFWCINRIAFKWDCVLCRVIGMMVWIGLWTKLRIYRVPPDPVIRSCWGFGSLWLSFMMSWMILSNNKLKVSHRKQVNAPSYSRLKTSLMKF